MSDNDFREQLFLAHLRAGDPANAEYVQEQAELCCKAWGHDYRETSASTLLTRVLELDYLVPNEDVRERLEGQRIAQTVGGTPVVSNLSCNRCGHKHHPTEKR